MRKACDRDMTVDYSVRCWTHVSMISSVDGRVIECQVIRYGVTESETRDNIWRDLDAPYAELSRGGRRPGDAVARGQHFFNKRIMTDEEKIKGGGTRNIEDKGADPTIRGGADPDAVGARDAGGGVGGPAQIAFPRAVAGGGDRAGYDFAEEDCPGHLAAPDDPKTCDRCGVRIDTLKPEGETT